MVKISNTAKHIFIAAILLITTLVLYFSFINYSGTDDNLQDSVAGYGSGYYGHSEDSLKYYISVVEKKTLLDEYWKLNYVNEWYKKRVIPPAFNFNVDLTRLGPVELRLLRNELLARNGFCFMDGFMRGYFKRYSWYQPLWDIKEFKIEFTKQEKDFFDKTIELENALMRNKTIKINNYDLLKYDFALNREQFNYIPDLMIQSLKTRNFAIVPADNEQLFYVYDKNQYGFVPNFITTDLYLQVMHMHFSRLLEKLEKSTFIGLMKNLLNSLYTKTNDFINKYKNETSLTGAAEWANTYYAIAYSLITDTKCNTPASYKSNYDSELKKVKDADGSDSEFLSSKILDYSTFKPRGNYADSANLRQYFHCVKWLMSAPMYMDNDNALGAAVLTAHLLLNSNPDLESFKKFNNAINFIVGEENNNSILQIANILENEFKGKAIEELLTADNLNKIKSLLTARDPRKMRVVAANLAGKIETERPFILFTAGRYTFDGEIFTRLVHFMDGSNMRTTPKGLDIFAASGNAAAEDILLNTYKEGARWKQFPDTLNVLKNKMKQKSDWNNNLYNKTMETILSLNNKQKEYPLFMQTPDWDKKNLNTALAAWTELKHDMILYSEQPMAAECGEGENAPPTPHHLAYVEPNTQFWTKAIEMIKFQDNLLKENNLLTGQIHNLNTSLIEIAEKLLTASYKELKGELFTAAELEKLSYVAAGIEYLTFRIVDSDKLPERDKNIAIIADVFSSREGVLNEAVGTADEIYVMVEINGLPYIARGAVFSYYEFIANNRYTDAEWQKQLAGKNAPLRPVWMRNIIIPVKSLDTKKEF